MWGSAIKMGEMSNVILTGASGFVGTALVDKLLARGDKVYALSRHPPTARESLVPLIGDITEVNLGLANLSEDIASCYHLAAIHRLGEDKDGSIWVTNVKGTANVIDFCIKHSIPHLFFCSTAYTQGRNTYEQSKAVCEVLVNHSKIPKVTVFKPSVIMGTEQYPYLGHFSQFVSAVIKIHQRAELIRKRIEGTLRLPILQPVFRIRGNPEGKLNLVTVDTVAQAMADIQEEGTFWLTNPNPPMLKELVEWVGEFILLDFRILPSFQPTPIEMMFQKMASAFNFYLEGDSFPSDLPACHITKEFIHKTLLTVL